MKSKKNNQFDKMALFFTICYVSIIIMSVFAMPILTLVLLIMKGNIIFTLSVFGVFALYGWISLIFYWIKIGTKMEAEYKKKYGWKWD